MLGDHNPNTTRKPTWLLLPDHVLTSIRWFLIRRVRAPLWHVGKSRTNWVLVSREIYFVARLEQSLRLPLYNGLWPADACW